MKPVDLNRNSSTLLTNFSEEMRVIYRVAAAEFGDPRIHVYPIATDAAPRGYGGSLHYIGDTPKYDVSSGLSEFWDVFNAVRDRLYPFGEAALKELAKGLKDETI